MSTTADLAAFVDRFSNLGTGRVGTHRRPHKPCMLLSVLSLADNGRLTENEIRPDPELVELFKRYFEIARAADDRCTPEYPFFYLKNDHFWHLKAHADNQAQVDTMSSPSSWAATVRLVAHTSLDEALFDLLADSAAREALRNTLVSSYFPNQRAEILAIAMEEMEIGAVRREWEEGSNPAHPGRSNARDAAFARTVKQAYDFRCAACGIRFIYEDTTMIDAAHLIPWASSRDDRPQNGMALCKNDHWVMDQRLIAPGPDLKWHVSACLDRRIEGHSKLLEIRGEEILLPKQQQLMPDLTGLEWRVKQLRAS
jgi:putative restriction endonuclease